MLVTQILLACRAVPPCRSETTRGTYQTNAQLPCSSSLSLGNYTGKIKWEGAPSSHSLPHTNSFTKVRRTEGFGTKISSQKGTIHLADFHSDKKKYQTFGK